MNESAPVILILYDAEEDKAYWLNVQEYFRGQGWAERAAQSTTATVPIRTANVLNEAAIRLFTMFRDASRDQSREQSS